MPATRSFELEAERGRAPFQCGDAALVLLFFIVLLTQLLARHEQMLLGPVAGQLFGDLFDGRFHAAIAMLSQKILTLAQNFGITLTGNYLPNDGCVCPNIPVIA